VKKRTVSEEELGRMKKRGGTRVRRKQGSKKASPEPERKDVEALSGVVASESSAPATKSAEDTIATAIAETLKVQRAAMAATNVVRDVHLEKLIENNTKVITAFKKELQNTETSKVQTPWRHKIRRKRDGFIDYIDSFPIESKEIG